MNSRIYSPDRQDDDGGRGRSRRLRAALDELSRSRARDGFTPSETALSVFTLKEALYELVADAADMAPEFLMFSHMVDDLGLRIFEAYSAAREQIISDQATAMLEISTPVVRLWDGIIAVPLVGTLDSVRTYARKLPGLIGGELTLHSDGAEGTTAVLTLPYGTPAVGTVVMADDDAASRELLKTMLTGIADRLVEAEDGAQALAAVAQGKVDLVLADLGMPDVDGSTLLKRLPPGLPTIVITGLDVEAPPRACALLRKEELTRERLAFAHLSGNAMTEPPAAVLLVDDDEAKRYVMATWLRRAGHTVTETAPGSEALSKVGDADLVLLDVNLPDMSGFDVCRQIKSDPATTAIPVIQVSATAVEIADRAQGLTQGADAYLVEPTEPRNCSPR